MSFLYNPYIPFSNLLKFFILLILIIIISTVLLTLITLLNFELGQNPLLVYNELISS